MASDSAALTVEPLAGSETLVSEPSTPTPGKTEDDTTPAAVLPSEETSVSMSKSERREASGTGMVHNPADVSFDEEFFDKFELGSEGYSDTHPSDVGNRSPSISYSAAARLTADSLASFELGYYGSGAIEPALSLDMLETCSVRSFEDSGPLAGSSMVSGIGTEMASLIYSQSLGITSSSAALSGVPPPRPTLGRTGSNSSITSVQSLPAGMLMAPEVSPSPDESAASSLSPMSVAPALLEATSRALKKPRKASEAVGSSSKRRSLGPMTKRKVLGAPSPNAIARPGSVVKRKSLSHRSESASLSATTVIEDPILPMDDSVPPPLLSQLSLDESDALPGHLVGVHSQSSDLGTLADLAAMPSIDHSPAVSLESTTVDKRKSKKKKLSGKITAESLSAKGTVSSSKKSGSTTTTIGMSGGESGSSSALKKRGKRSSKSQMSTANSERGLIGSDLSSMRSTQPLMKAKKKKDRPGSARADKANAVALAHSSVTPAPPVSSTVIVTRQRSRSSASKPTSVVARKSRSSVKSSKSKSRKKRSRRSSLTDTSTGNATSADSKVPSSSRASGTAATTTGDRRRRRKLRDRFEEEEKSDTLPPSIPARFQIDGTLPSMSDTEVDYTRKHTHTVSVGGPLSSKPAKLKRRRLSFGSNGKNSDKGKLRSTRSKTSSVTSAGSTASSSSSSLKHRRHQRSAGSSSSSSAAAAGGTGSSDGKLRKQTLYIACDMDQTLLHRQRVQWCVGSGPNSGEVLYKKFEINQTIGEKVTHNYKRLDEDERMKSVIEDMIKNFQKNRTLRSKLKKEAQMERDRALAEYRRKKKMQSSKKPSGSDGTRKRKKQGSSSSVATAAGSSSSSSSSSSSNPSSSASLSSSTGSSSASSSGAATPSTTALTDIAHAKSDSVPSSAVSATSASSSSGSSSKRQSSPDPSPLHNAVDAHHGRVTSSSKKRFVPPVPGSLPLLVLDQRDPYMMSRTFHAGRVIPLVGSSADELKALSSSVASGSDSSSSVSTKAVKKKRKKKVPSGGDSLDGSVSSSDTNDSKSTMKGSFKADSKSTLMKISMTSLKSAPLSSSVDWSTSRSPTPDAKAPSESASMSAAEDSKSMEQSPFASPPPPVSGASSSSSSSSSSKKSPQSGPVKKKGSGGSSSASSKSGVKSSSKKASKDREDKSEDKLLEQQFHQRLFVRPNAFDFLWKVFKLKIRIQKESRGMIDVKVILNSFGATNHVRWCKGKFMEIGQEWINFHVKYTGLDHSMFDGLFQDLDPSSSSFSSSGVASVAGAADFIGHDSSSLPHSGMSLEQRKKFLSSWMRRLFSFLDFARSRQLKSYFAIRKYHRIAKERYSNQMDGFPEKLKSKMYDGLMTKDRIKKKDIFKLASEVEVSIENVVCCIDDNVLVYFYDLHLPIYCVREFRVNTFAEFKHWLNDTPPAKIVSLKDELLGRSLSVLSAMEEDSTTMDSEATATVAITESAMMAEDEESIATPIPSRMVVSPLPDPISVTEVSTVSSFAVARVIDEDKKEKEHDQDPDSDPSLLIEPGISALLTASKESRSADATLISDSTTDMTPPPNNAITPSMMEGSKMDVFSYGEQMMTGADPSRLADSDDRLMSDDDGTMQRGTVIEHPAPIEVSPSQVIRSLPSSKVEYGLDGSTGVILSELPTESIIKVTESKKKKFVVNDLFEGDNWTQIETLIRGRVSSLSSSV